MVRLATFACAMLLLSGAPAHADLIHLGNGMIYDSLQDLTWLQDTHYARTSGVDSDGWMSQPDAIAWADTLTFGGYDDWRLPSFTSSTDLDHSSEISTLLTQLGWHWPNWGQVNLGGTGPFLYLTDTPSSAIPMYWLGNSPSMIWNQVYVYDLRDGGASSPAGAWAVRDGRAVASVPEPSALLFVGMGFLGALRKVLASARTS